VRRGPGTRPGGAKPPGGNWKPPASTGADGMGGQDHTFAPGELGAAQKICGAATGKGIECTVHTSTGGHTWQFASAAFVSSQPWLNYRLGLPVAQS
jgi:S-formylglutathione hydrolase FrmB